MNHFHLVYANIPVDGLVDEIQQHENLWSANTSRQDTIRVQRHTNTIFLRSAVKRPDLHVNENQESRPTAVSQLFPKALQFMSAIAQEFNAELSRATIVRLMPHSSVPMHIDIGSYYLIRNRYHLVLVSSEGSVMSAGGESVCMRPGELWWFDNKQHHDAHNTSSAWRLHYIFDLLPKQLSYLAVNPAMPISTI